MHMWMWFGYDLGEFLFPGLTVSSRWSFALTWIALFFVALLYEGSKVYLAKVQREAIRRLMPYRSDERRNLLCDREQGSMEPTTSRNATSVQITTWMSIRVRALVNAHQSLVFIAHNVVGYLLMLAVMLYNVHLLIAVICGAMLGYFLFGPKLTRIQMQCFGTKRVIICTPECDDTAETTTPPLLDSPLSSESDLFICQTRTCIQPSHYFRATTSQDGSVQHAACHYGAKKCLSKLAKAKKTDQYPDSEKEDSPSVEDAQLLRTERHGCCKKKPEPPPEQDKKCCKKEKETTVDVHEESCCKEDKPIEEDRNEELREQSPPVTCCHAKNTETTTPPLLDSPLSSESDLFICQTRTCIQPSHYFRATTSQDGSVQHAACHYGAKKCLSKLARAKKTDQYPDSEKEDSPSVEDAQLLRTERHGCCKKKPEPPPEQDKKCCKKEKETTVEVHEESCCKEERPIEEDRIEEQREQTPPVTCCHSKNSESQEQIIT